MKEGIYEEIITHRLKRELDAISSEQFVIERDAIDADDARKMLASYISTVTRRALSYIRDKAGEEKPEALLNQIRVCNEIINTLSDRLENDEIKDLQIEEQGEILTSIYNKLNTTYFLHSEKPIRPVTPLSESSLFTGSHAEPNMLEELKREIVSSNSIDWIVSFIKWSGLRCILDELKYFTEVKSGKLRVITTSYMEATDYKAIEELSKLPNTEIRISFDKKRTRLHAKAYLFKRDTKFSTAYIGSSNLSNPALTSGLEWNLKVTEKDSFDIIRKFEATFESYWNDPEFKELRVGNPDDWITLEESLKKPIAAEEQEQYYLDIQPYHYQKEILEQLSSERITFGRNKNLVVAATGVGKTVISAFDFKRFLQANRNAKLLFVAHREEILKQSLGTFRAILKDPNFGDLFVGRNRPVSIDHLFMSIQSWNSQRMDIQTTKDFYDFIIVDEFHHAEAPSYKRLLSYYEPQILLGLTATPERMDGKDILVHFDGRIAAEMRLTEAIDRKLLSPFHYFCVTDTVDLEELKWTRKGYDIGELSNVYTNNRRRSEHIVSSLRRYVASFNDVKGLGFCVSVEHAIYMASFFTQSGLPSIALHGDSPQEERNQAKRKLESGEIRFIFVVDLYNEGVDIPSVNTILFLRPTESLTVFLQQLGRGLRLAEEKECLTVLDFVGQAHKEYSFEDKFRALIGNTRHSVRYYVENGFSFLPKGCFMKIEKQAKEYVLRSLQATKNTKTRLLNKIKHFEEDTKKALTLSNFMKYHHLTLPELYGKNRLFERMKVEAGVAQDFSSPFEEVVTKRIHSLFHLDSAELIRFYLKYLEDGQVRTEEERKMIAMLYYSFFLQAPEREGFRSTEEGIQTLLRDSILKEEIKSVLTVRYQSIDFVEKPSPFAIVNPLRVHAHYTTDQVMAAFGYFDDEQKPAFREGVKHFEEQKIDALFITLNKSDKDFSPSTMYEDYAISDYLFHWQSQSRTSDTSQTAFRYFNHRKMGHQIALFVREYRKEDGYTAPYVFLGTADYVQHEGSQPVSIIWRLHVPMPPKLVPKANKSII
ncbi:DUF3427 domain-containing protein [Chungangia koreensis]|uniref:DUF3427 domain-containing protein n=1 Tax=Chungangia koreensis TaxID=752657 RepID=A0ABV8X8B1_9LACT